MFLLIDDSNKQQFHEDLDRIHLLRNEVFVEQLKWPHLRSTDGREYDDYDTPGAVYIALKEGDEIAAAVRLNWFDQPTLLAEVFPKLVEFEKIPSGASSVDLSRFVVSPKFGARDRMNRHGCELITAILEYGLAEKIENYTAVISTHFFATVLHWGVEAYAMGFPVGDGRDAYLAVRVPVTEKSVANLYRYSGDHNPRFREPDFVRQFTEITGQIADAAEARRLERRSVPSAAE